MVDPAPSRSLPALAVETAFGDHEIRLSHPDRPLDDDLLEKAELLPNRLVDSISQLLSGQRPRGVGVHNEILTTTLEVNDCYLSLVEHLSLLSLRDAARLSQYLSWISSPRAYHG